MIVVDANVVVYFYVEGEHTPGAEAVFARDPEWAAPYLWRSEFRNALLGFVRRRGLAIEDAMHYTDDAERRMAGREYTIVSDRVLTLAVRLGCSAYECEYVALAQDLGRPLVTTDAQVLMAFPSVAVTPERFAR